MATLTVLIPNYNRAKALSRLLKTIYASIAYAGAEEQVQVLVVDDYSTERVDRAIEPYIQRANFMFAMQGQKCGNAETAFLNALDHVTTEYVWLLGNDDYMSLEGVGYLLRVLSTSRPGFVLLNPHINKTTLNRGFVPLNATAQSVAYERTEDIFLDFGFVTSTTTFPCLVMKAEPVRAFHRTHRLLDRARVYSHTFTVYGALREEPGLFLSSPIVGFTLNERIEEQKKLQKQAPDGIMFYHQSLGLARLISQCSAATGASVRKIGAAFEDEVNKDEMRVVRTHLSHFLAFFFLEQLSREQINIQAPGIYFGHLARSEIDEISALVRRFDDERLWTLCAEAIDAHDWQAARPAWKITFLRTAQDRVRYLAQERYREANALLPSGTPRKVSTPEYSMIAMRGADGGRYGLVRRKGSP